MNALKSNQKLNVQADSGTETYQDQYIKLERIAAYIRKADSKIKQYREKLKAVQQEMQIDSLEMIHEIKRREKMIIK